MSDCDCCGEFVDTDQAPVLCDQCAEGCLNILGYLACDSPEDDNE